METNGIKNIFSVGVPGELRAMMARFGFFSDGVANGSAAETLDAGVGETNQVDFLPI